MGSIRKALDWMTSPQGTVIPIIGIAAILLWSAIVRPAPAPRKPPPPAVLPAASFVGTWDMAWAGHTYHVTLSAGGGYVEDGPEGRWAGTWEVKEGYFRVDHAYFDTVTGTFRPPWGWKVKLHPGRRAGKEYEFELRPPKPDF